MDHGSSSDSIYPEDRFGRVVWWMDRLLKPIEQLLTLIGGLLIFGLMIIGMVQIVMRNIFRAPIFGYVDMVEFAMIGFALFAISYVQREGIHVRMELLVGALRGRAQWLFEFLSTLAGVVIITILIPYTYLHFERSYRIGDSTIDIELPTWPGKLAVAVILSVLLVRLVIQTLGYLRLVIRPNAQPVAVPLIKSVAQVAEEEVQGATR